MNPQDQQRLERLVSSALRDLPPRRAPSSLEMRVQAEIARRAALPWWRKSFVSWPLPARAVFVIASLGLIKLAFDVFGWASSSVNTAPVKMAVASDLHWLQVAHSFLQTLNETFGAVLGTIPSLWLYGGIAVVIALYLALFGLGAAAYRTLYASR